MIISNTEQILKNKVTGVIHVGAHEGQERDFYDTIGCQNVDWYEANPEIFEVLLKNLEGKKGQRCFNHAVSNFIGKAKFHISSNRGESSSLRDMKLHKMVYPNIGYVKEIEVDCKTLDSIYTDPHNFNFLYMDAQGVEYDILEGSHNLLINNIQYVYSEVSFCELYAGGKLAGDVHELLTPYGFELINIVDSLNGWGDALYQKK